MRRATKGSNKNRRPNSYESRKLKTWMLSQFGDGITVPCHGTCGRTALFYSEFTKDLYPIPARRGGRYTKDNCRPLCQSCNSSEGARSAAAERREAKQKRDARNARRRELYALKRSEVASQTCRLTPNQESVA